MLLTDEEKKVNDYIKYHTPTEREPNNYNQIFLAIYKKWLSVFSNANKKLYKDINPIRIGKLMKRIRENHYYTMASLARILDVDVSTISLYERGKRVPSLNYTAKFCAMFSIKIDNLVNLILD